MKYLLILAVLAGCGDNPPQQAGVLCGSICKIKQLPETPFLQLDINCYERCMAVTLPKCATVTL